MDFELLFSANIGSHAIAYLYSANREYGFRLDHCDMGDDITIISADDVIEKIADDLEAFESGWDDVDEIEANTYLDLCDWFTYPDGVVPMWEAIRDEVHNAIND